MLYLTLKIQGVLWYLKVRIIMLSTFLFKEYSHEKYSKRVQHFWVAVFQFGSKIKSTYPYLLPATLTKALWQKLKNPEPLCLFRPQYRDLDPLDIMHYYFPGWMSRNMFLWGSTRYRPLPIAMGKDFFFPQFFPSENDNLFLFFEVDVRIYPVLSRHFRGRYCGHFARAVRNLQ